MSTRDGFLPKRNEMKKVRTLAIKPKKDAAEKRRSKRKSQRRARRTERQHRK